MCSMFLLRVCLLMLLRVFELRMCLCVFVVGAWLCGRWSVWCGFVWVLRLLLLVAGVVVDVVEVVVDVDVFLCR